MIIADLFILLFYSLTNEAGIPEKLAKIPRS